MKILFWNIGKKLTEKKLKLISEAISTENPDVFCIAEGSYSKKDCKKVIDVFVIHNYNCYYSPLFSENKGLKLNYKYKSNGLKIFIKNNIIPKEPFSFSNQRNDGRIVVLKVNTNFRPTTFIFLHNFSKSGTTNITLDQTQFILSINEMITYGKIADDTDRLLLIGDFNLEPWDNILRHKKYLRTNFFQNHNSMIQRSTDPIKNYFNPLAELIFQSKIENLGGTFYSDTSGWALFDYVLYDTKDSNITYNIITEFSGGSKLLNDDIEIQSAFLNNDLDHLPIITKINN